VQRGDARGVDGPVGAELGVELLRPEGFDSAGGEGASDEGPVGFDEAEHAVDRYGVVEVFTHDGDLVQDAVDQLGAVASPDHELLDSRTQEPTFDLEVRSTGVLLGIDHVDTGGCHGDVVDVGSRAWYPPVVQDPELVGGQLVESLTQSFLADGPDVPCPGRLRVFAEGVDQTADLGVRRTEAFLATGTTALELTPSGCAGRSSLDRILGSAIQLQLGCRGLKVVGAAADGLRGALVDRFCLGWQYRPAHAAGPLVAQAHPLLT
jgi:hypothetical protein